VPRIGLSAGFTGMAALRWLIAGFKPDGRMEATASSGSHYDPPGGGPLQ
jgi:hypothetical protein